MTTPQEVAHGYEARIDGLKALIARRQSQGAHLDTIKAAQRELHDVSAEFLRWKIDRGEWEPAELIERMSLQRVPLAAAPVTAPPTVVNIDETREQLKTLLAEHRDNFIPRSKLQDLIQ